MARGDAVVTMNGVDQGEVTASAGKVRATLSGVVTGVSAQFGVDLAGEVALVQGVFGIGRETFGHLVVLPFELREPSSLSLEEESLDGGIVVFSGSLRPDVLKDLERRGARGAIAGSADGRDLMEYVGSYVNPASTGKEHVGIVLMLTEGFGSAPMQRKTFELLGRLAGKQVVLSGATQMRAGVMRPELLADPLPREITESENTVVDLAPELTVRITRGRHLGKIGIIKVIPREPQIIATGAIVPVLEIELAGGERQLVPRSNVEIFG